MNTTAGCVIMVAATLVMVSGTLLAEQKSPSSQGGQPPAATPVTIRFWGQACFTIVADGKTILIDPYSPKVGYKPFAVQPDLVLITHEHFDHNDTSWLQGKPVVLHGLGEGGEVQQVDRRVGPFRVRTVAARHWSDPANQQRGNDTIFVIEVNGLRIVHVGDLGEKLSGKQAEAIGTPDVLMVPVGGFYTIDADGAYAAVQQLKPRAYVIPMHYRTAALEASLRSRLAEPEPFLQKFGDNVVRLNGNELKVDPAALPKDLKVVSMGYVPSAMTQPSGSK